MAHEADLPTRRTRGLLGLFEEAWRRQRQRRTRWALLALVAIFAAGVLIRADRPVSGRPGSPPGRAAFARLSSGSLPASGHFASLTQVGGRVMLAGGPAAQPLNVSGAATSLLHGRAAGRCTTAIVAPDSVRLLPARHANCGDPALYGLTVMPIISLQHTRANRPAMDELRIAVADPTAHDGYRIGPVLMRYGECSDCGAQWIVGDHALWINGPLAHPHVAGGEVLQISLKTGRPVQRFAVPQLSRALLAVDRNGLWIAPSIETGVPGRRLTPRILRAYDSLYLIAPGARHAHAVLDVGSSIPWLAASGHRVWLEEISQRTARMLSFTGTNARRLREGPRQHTINGVANEIGEGTTPYAADPASGVDGIIAPDDAHQAVVSYDTHTLTEHVLATTPQPNAYLDQPDTVATANSFYFLDAQISLAVNAIPGRLYLLKTG